MTFHSVYSKKHAGQLLHAVVNALEQGTDRIDVSPTEEHLQVSVLPLHVGRQVQPHIHQPREAPAREVITQESWLVLRGKVRVRLFDLDQTFLEEKDLLPGWLLVTYRGGHALECLEEDSVMLEFKNGPYLGRDYQSFLQD